MEMWVQTPLGQGESKTQVFCFLRKCPNDQSSGQNGPFFLPVCDEGKLPGPVSASQPTSLGKPLTFLTCHTMLLNNYDVN